MVFHDLPNVFPLRAWLVADATTIPSIAKPPDITITPDRISLAFFGGGAELYAVSIGRLYEVEKSPITYSEAEVSLHGTKGQLSLMGGKSGKIVAQDENSCAIAYLPSKGEAQGLSIVSQLSDRGQVAIGVGGSVEVSPDLSGRHIKFAQFPLVIPPMVSISQTGFKSLEARIVYMDKGEPYLAQLPATLIPSSQHIEQERRRIELVYLRDRVTTQKL